MVETRNAMSDAIPPLTVLLYHDIVAAGDQPLQDKGSIWVDRLIEHVRALQDSGIEIVDLNTTFGLLVDGSPSSDPKKCALTFDDGLTGVYSFLPELLKVIPIRPSVFILTEYVGQKNTWNTRTPIFASHMSLPMLLELKERGLDLQLHGTDHHNLSKFTQDELQERFAQGIAWFEQNLGFTPQYLAYPYGAYTNTVAEVVPHYFQGALSVNHGSWWGPGARWSLNRISVPFYLSGQDLVAVLAVPPDQRWIEIEKRAPWWRRQAE